MLRSLSLQAKLLLILVFVAALLRLWQLGSLPASLHRDETSIGYNAYSLLMTGKDEHGVSWPVNFQAFGDYKLPGMIYASILPIWLFGLNSWVVRLPTAVAAILSIPAAYWLTRQLGWKSRIALFTAIFLSLDFWHISQARNVYEPMVGLLFAMIAWGSWLKAQTKPAWYLFAILNFGLSIAFYNVPLLLLPFLFAVSSILVHGKKIRSNSLHLGFIFVPLAVSLITAWVLSGVNASRSDTVVFFHQDITQSADYTTHAGLVGGLPSIVSRTINHPYLLAGLRVGRGYLAAFDPNYLFFVGDHNPWHNLYTIHLGNINPVLLLAFLAGIYKIWQDRQQLTSQLTLLYLLATPLVSAVTIDAPITNRLLEFHVAVLIVSAVGANQWWQLWQNSKNWQRWIFPSFILVYLGFFSLFLLKYFWMYNPLLPEAWNPGSERLMTQIANRADQYDRIVVSEKFGFNFSYFAFYTPFNPHDWQSQARWYHDGLDMVAQFNNYHFLGFPDWDEFSTENIATFFDNDHQRILIVGTGDATGQPDVIWEEKNWRGQSLWYLREVNISDAIDGLNSVNADKRMIEYLTSCQNSLCNQLILE